MDYRMPLYIQLQDIIIKKIEEGQYLPGEAIPSERKMAERYGVNRMTVKRAVEKLVEEGYLLRKPGSGTYVAKRDHKKIDLDYASNAGNTGLTALFREIGVDIVNKVLAQGDIADSKFLAYKLALTTEDVIWGLHRLRYGDGEPFAVEYNYLPKKLFPDVDNFDFNKVSLYDYMAAYGHMPTHFSQRLTICNANEKIAELLRVKRGSAIFKIEYQGADEEYNIVEFTSTFMNPSYSEFIYNAETI